MHSAELPARPFLYRACPRKRSRDFARTGGPAIDILTEDSGKRTECADLWDEWDVMAMEK